MRTLRTYGTYNSVTHGHIGDVTILMYFYYTYIYVSVDLSSVTPVELYDIFISNTPQVVLWF
jgi:hypothetical protein